MLRIFSDKATKSQLAKPNIGLTEGKLRPCGPKPNCVCSTYTSDDHFIEAIKYNKDPAKFETDVRSYVASKKSFKLITLEINYAHIEDTSKIFGFVDDLELQLVDSIIEVRSASRVGYSDLGANQKRVEATRKFFESLE